MKNIYILFLIFISTAISQEDASPAIVEFATGFSSPVDIKNAGDSRLFIAEQTGAIKIVQGDGSVNETPFLTLDVNDTGNEQGLLGIVFHPNYANNGFFYVNYITDANSTQISRFTVSDDPDVANSASELSILTIPQPFSNHNGGCMQFGPDGFLYIGLGDGGSGGDPGNRAQNPTILLGKMLRIDIDTPSNGNNYSIPADNPFINDNSTLNEIWALGLRNPWKFSFDDMTGDLWIADVGQNEIEEINKATNDLGGLNYGWRCYEGTAPFNTSDCPEESSLTFPLVDYTHSGNGEFKCSVTGGYVYRGDTYPGMQGLYVFGDFCSDELATIDSAGNLLFFNASPGGLSSLGEDIQNELYVAGLVSGTIFKVVDANLSTQTSDTSTFSLFPNPSTEMVTLIRTNLGINTQLNLYDLRGTLIKTTEISNNQTVFSVAELAAGIYIARISSSSQIIKLVVL